MLLLRDLLLAAGVAMFAAAAAMLLYDAFRWWIRFRAPEAEEAEALRVQWRLAGKLAAAGWLPLLAGLSIVGVPSGMAGVRVSQIWGPRPGAVYPGGHCVGPPLAAVALNDTPARVFTTTARE